jgi:hypothetical protein
MPDPTGGLLTLGLATAGTSAIGAHQQSQAAKGATAAQVAAGDKAIAEGQRQFDAFQKVLAPYTEGGESALGGMLDILGLSGPEKASEAVIDIESSPVFQSIAEQGEKGILARASATGGLRGGNVQGALAQFRPNLLNNFINQRFGQLGSVAQLGQASAAGTGAAGIETGRQAQSILQNQGEAVGQGLLARGNLASQPFSALSQMGGFAFGKQF